MRPPRPRSTPWTWTASRPSPLPRPCPPLGWPGDLGRPELPRRGAPRILLQCGKSRSRGTCRRRAGGTGQRPGRTERGERLLADRRLRFVLAALIASGAADGVGPVTMSFAVLRVTGSPGRLGLVLAGQATAALAFTLAGGLAGDRFGRGRILTCSLAGRAAAATLLAATLLTRTASFPLLLAAAAAYGCADGFFGPASTALLPDIVPRDRLSRANALLGGTT